MPRLFIAIDLPDRILDDISSTYSAIPGTRWIEEQQLHITLRFIGEVDAAKAEQITKALSTISSPPFTVRLKGVGFFPLRGEPRVLWIGIDENQELVRLQVKIERVVSGLGLKPEDRKFHSHITVARLTDAPREKVVQYITENSLFSTDPFAISHFYLYESITRREGAHYIKTADYTLRNENVISS